MQAFSVTLLAIFFLLAGTLEAQRPNILLILSDDHSVPHLGAYGDENCIQNDITPNLDVFARESMRFDRAYTTAPQCAPSRISMFTGQSPVRTGTTRFSQPPPASTILFTDLLREGGYWVGLEGRNQHLVGKRKEPETIEKVLIEQGMRGPAFENRFDHFEPGAKTKNEELAGVPEMVAAALDTVPEGKPFFLYFGFNQPHRKWGEDHEGIDPATLKLPPDWPDLPGVRTDYARFLGELRDLDRGFGSIMKLLDDRKLAGNTLVVFMGDNGEALLRGKGTLFDRGLHVPLLIRWPDKVEPGTASDTLISGIDLAPTFLEAAGISTAENMTGTSFLPALLGQPFVGQEYIFGERGWHHGPVTRTDGFDLSRAIISKRYYLIYNILPERMYAPVDMMRNNIAWEGIKKAHADGQLSKRHQQLYFQNPRPIFEFYDIVNDPFMLDNLSGKNEVLKIEASMRSELDAWMIREGDFAPLSIHAFELKE